MVHRLVFAALGTLALHGCDSPPREVTIADAWVRLPAVPGRPGAGYFTLTGSPSATETLVGVDSPKAERIELHSGGMSGGMMTMRPLGEVTSEVDDRRFAPGGDHLMIFGIDPSVKAGEVVALRFRFKGGRDVAVEAKTVAAGQVMPAN